MIWVIRFGESQGKRNLSAWESGKLSTHKDKCTLLQKNTKPGALGRHFDAEVVGESKLLKKIQKLLLLRGQTKKQRVKLSCPPYWKQRLGSLLYIKLCKPIP